MSAAEIGPRGTVFATCPSTRQVEVVMLRLVSLIALLACVALPAMAQRVPVPAAAADKDDEDDEDDDDILAPVRTGDKPATVIPVKERATKVGILPIVPLGDVGKSLGDQLSTELIKAMNESTSVEFVALALQSASGAAAIDPAVALSHRHQRPVWPNDAHRRV